jgi:hypothetical protein
MSFFNWSLNTTQKYLEPSSDAKRRLVDLV